MALNDEQMNRFEALGNKSAMSDAEMTEFESLDRMASGSIDLQPPQQDDFNKKVEAASFPAPTTQDYVKQTQAPPVLPNQSNVSHWKDPRQQEAPQAPKESVSPLDVVKNLGSTLYDEWVPGSEDIDLLKRGVNYVVDPIRNNIVRPGIELALQKPEEAAKALAEGYLTPGGFLSGAAQMALRGATDESIGLNPKAPSSDSMSTSEVLARQGLEPIAGVNMMPGGVNEEVESSLENPEAYKIANKLESSLGATVGPVIQWTVQQIGNVPYYTLGGGLAGDIEGALAKGAGTEFLAGKDLIPHLLRKAIGGSVEGFSVGAKQGFLQEEGKPVTNAVGGLVIGGVAAPVSELMNSGVKAGLKAAKDVASSAVGVFDAHFLGTSKVLALFGVESKGLLLDSINAFADSELVQGQVKVAEEAAQYTKDKRAWSRKNPNFKPTVIETDVDPSGNIVLKMTEIDVTNPNRPFSRQKKIVTDVKTAQDILELHPNTWVEHSEAAKPKMIYEVARRIDKPKMFGTLTEAGKKEAEQVAAVQKSEEGTNADSPKALIAVSDGKNVKAVVVPTSAPSMVPRKPGEVKLGDVVRVPSKFVKGGEINGTLKSVDGSLGVILTENGTKRVPMSLIKSAEGISEENLVIRKQALMQARASWEAKVKAKAKVAPPEVKPAVEPSPSELEPTKASTPRRQAERNLTLPPRQPMEVEYTPENLSNIVKHWRKVTPERLMQAEIANDLPQALTILEWMKSHDMVQQVGPDAVYIEKPSEGKLAAPPEAIVPPTFVPTDHAKVNGDFPVGVEKPPTPEPKSGLPRVGDLVGFNTQLRTKAMVEAGVYGINGAVAEVRPDGTVKVIEPNGTTHFLDVKETNTLRPISWSDKKLNDVLKTQDIPGITSPLDLSLWVHDPSYAQTTLAGLDIALKSRTGIGVGATEQTVQLAKRLWRFTAGAPQDTVAATRVPDVVQGFRAAGGQESIAAKFIESARKSGVGPGTDAANDLVPVLEASLDKTKAGQERAKWAAKYPKQAKRFGDTLTQMQDELRMLQERLTAAGVSSVEFAEIARAVGEDSEYATAMYAAFIIPDKWAGMLMEQAEHYSKLNGMRNGKPLKTPVLQGAIDYLSRYAKKTPSELANDVAEILRLPDAAKQAEAFQAKGYVSQADAAKLKERRVWDTPELKAVKELLGPVNDPIIRLGYSVAHANALLSSVEAGNALTRTPYFSRVARFDLNYKIPDEPQFGAARGGYTDAELAPFIDRNMMSTNATELAKNIQKAAAVWKMNVVALGGFAPWVNNVIRSFKNVIAAGGPLNGVKYYDALQSIQAMHSNPSMFGPAAQARKGMNLGVLTGGMAGNEANIARIQMRREVMNAARKSMELSGDGGFHGFMSGILDSVKLKGTKALGAVVEYYDLHDQVVKLATFTHLEEKYLASGMHPDDAATKAAARVLRFFPDWTYTPPIVKQSKLLQGTGIVNAFLSSKWNDARISMNIAGDLRKDPKLAMRMMFGAAAVGGMYAAINTWRRASGYSDEEVASNYRNEPTAEKMKNPAQIALPGMWGQTKRGTPIRAYADMSNADDLLMGFRGVNPNHPLGNQVFDWLAWQAQDTLPVLDQSPVMQQLEVSRGNDKRVIEGQVNSIADVAKIVGKNTLNKGALPQAVNRWYTLYDRVNNPQPLQTPDLPATLAYMQAIGLRVAPNGTSQQAMSHGMEMQQAGKDWKNDANSIYSPFNPQTAGMSIEQKNEMARNRNAAGKIYFEKNGRKQQ